jgi:hypothetical protein
MKSLVQQILEVDLVFLRSTRKSREREEGKKTKGHTRNPGHHWAVYVAYLWRGH